MVHYCLHAAPGSVLFRTHREARALWDRLVERVRFRSLVLMPAHVHLDPPDRSELRALAAAARAYALWRNRQRGEAGPVWAPIDEPRPVEGDGHLERTWRYILLNPCREGLAGDPLAWPWSTHRDAVGLAVRPVTRRSPDPARFHAYVSGDPSVNVAGSSLPEPRPAGDGRSATLAEVLAAVSSLTRTPLAQLRTHGPARQLFVRAARALTPATSAAIARLVGVHPSTVRHAATDAPDPALLVIERVLGDPRFAALHDGDLRREPAWRRYRHLR